jgi:PAS domain S-box-containing protein
MGKRNSRKSGLGRGTPDSRGQPSGAADPQGRQGAAAPSPDAPMQAEQPAGATSGIPVIGLGGSAGALDCFKAFFEAMPPDSGAAFVVIQHLAPAHESLLPELLARYTRMKVAQVEDGTPVEPNCVYVIPPNRDLGICDGVLYLTEQVIHGGIRMSIDFFLRSLAEDRQERAVCVLLSGAGSDGTLGVRAIRGAGGLTVAQDPATAQYGDLPRSAIATRLVDYILPPGEMPQADGVVVTFDDVTTLRRAEERTRRLATVVADSNDAVILVDPQGNIQAWNRGAQAMYGWSEQEASRMNLRDLAPPEDAAGTGDLVRRLAAGDVVASAEAKRRTKDGRVLDVWLTTTAVLDESKRVAAIATTERDITERKAAEEALRKTAEELVRSNKELEQFAYVASHDLQEPLRMVSGFLRLLAERYEPQLDDKAREYIGYAVEGADRMSQLIVDLLAFSRVATKGKTPEPVDASWPVDAALADLRTSIDSAGATVTHDEMPCVLGDASQLGQLFQNLIANAVKFRSPDRPCQVHVGAEKKDGQWVFSVRDNGIGIARQGFDRIFVIFQRLHTRAQYPGTGIGLAICKKIVERHGGRIWVESQVGEGTTFYFTLPSDRTP